MQGHVPVCRMMRCTSPSLICHVSATLSVSCLFFVYRLFWLPSVLWHCWLGVRKSNQPVKIEWWDVDVVICLERGADCLHMVQLMPLHPKIPSSLASFKSRVVLPFWYWLTQINLEKRPLNGCSKCLISHSCYLYYLTMSCFPAQKNDVSVKCLKRWAAVTEIGADGLLKHD